MISEELKEKIEYQLVGDDWHTQRDPVKTLMAVANTLSEYSVPEEVIYSIIMDCFYAE